MDADLLFFTSLILAIIITQVAQRKASPIGYIINRWIRWIVFSLCGAKLLLDFSWTNRPFWLFALALALAWLLLETLYNWFVIKALSNSDIPLFPKYTVNSDGVDLLLHPRFQKLQTWIRQNGFKRIQSIKSTVMENVDVWMGVYQDSTASCRLQISLLPQPGNRLAAAFSFATQTTAGDTYVTDNHFLPFGGFYPENWKLERKPLCRSIAKLLKNHTNRLARDKVLSTPWTSDPLVDINNHQAELERINIELGFLVQRADRTEQGKITPAGRYRIWKEYWLLNYLGRSAKYI